LFATTWDVYLLLGDLPEEPESTHTADGRPATRQHAHDRIARSICGDRTLVSWDDAVAMAASVAEAQLARITEAARRVLSGLADRPSGVVLSGQGEFLARRVVQRTARFARVVSLSERLGSDLSRVATAHALAVLAEETGGQG
jgi:uncharacterized hydantoinase/oxoprolinase family protein